MPFSLYDNTSWAGATETFSAQIETDATRFGVTAPCNLIRLRWYRHSTTASYRPTNLLLYRAGNTTPLVNLTSIADSGAVGWQATTLATPVPLDIGVTYLACAAFAANIRHGILTPRAAISPAPAPALFDDNIAGWHFGGVAYPENVGNTGAYGCDATLETGEYVPVPPDVVTESDLASWLSADSTPQTHESDGLPWLSKVVLDDLAAFSKGTGSYAESGLLPRLINIATLLVALTTIVNNLVDTVNGIASWFSSGTRPAGQDAIDAILNRIDLNTIGLRAGAGAGEWADGRVLCEDQHELAETYPFTGQVGWGSGLALHKIHIDTSDARHPMIDIGAAGWWVPGVGWWAATLPDGSLTNRTPLEFADQWLWPVPRCATGVLIWVHPSVTGTLYSYTVPEPPP